MNPTDERLKRVLIETRRIALVGASMNPARPSFEVGTYMADAGYEVIGVNPGHAGKTLYGRTVVASLGDIEGPIDMLDLFRRSEAVLPVVEEALDALPGLKTVWMQIGVENAEARALAESRGLTVIENRCPKIEHARLLAR